MTVDFDEFVNHITEGLKRNQVVMAQMMDGYCRVISYDYDKIYSDYAEAIGKPRLTQEEKQQAILNHVLEND